VADSLDIGSVNGSSKTIRTDTTKPVIVDVRVKNTHKKRRNQTTNSGEGEGEGKSNVTVAAMVSTLVNAMLSSNSNSHRIVS